MQDNEYQWGLTFVIPFLGIWCPVGDNSVPLKCNQSLRDIGVSTKKKKKYKWNPQDLKSLYQSIFGEQIGPIYCIHEFAIEIIIGYWCRTVPN